MQFSEVALIYLKKAKVNILKIFSNQACGEMKKKIPKNVEFSLLRVGNLATTRTLISYCTIFPFLEYCDVEVKYNDHMKEVHKNYLLI